MQKKHIYHEVATRRRESMIDVVWAVGLRNFKTAILLASLFGGPVTQDARTRIGRSHIARHPKFQAAFLPDVLSDPPLLSESLRMKLEVAELRFLDKEAERASRAPRGPAEHPKFQENR